MDQFTFEIDRTVTGVWPDYKKFIEKLRSNLTYSHSHNRPVLRPEQKEPVERFQVVLKLRSETPEITLRIQITLRIRRDNLYLDGYRARDSDPWLVFGKGTGPNFLGFGGSYRELATAAHQLIKQIKLGPQELGDAVAELATTTDGRKRARRLIVVIQMICEAIRFSRISDHLARPLKEGAEPPDWMIALEHGWGNLSDALLRADADPNHFFRLTKFNDMEIKTAEAAAAVLGILKFFDYRKSRILDKNMLSLRQGRPMVEVFWVRIDNIGGGRDPGQLHGTIAVVDGLSSQTMYDRQKGSPETISPGGNILLTGPNRAISALDSFTVDLSLQNKATPSRDDEVSNGSIIWNVFDSANNVFDRILYADVKGAHGSATACYAVLSDAVEATISVELVNAGGKDPAQVYGEIAASYSNYPSGQRTLLFRKKREEHISVRPGQPIGLTKKTVAVPTSHSLSVRAELYDSRTTPPGGEIVNGVAVLPPLFDGESQMNITGRFGNVLVKVAWNPSWRPAN